MAHEPMELPASEVKNAWHECLDMVTQARQEIVITKYGKPIARLVPIEPDSKKPGVVGHLAGSVTIHADIVEPAGEAWEADG